MDGVVGGECGQCTKDTPDVRQEAPSATRRWQTEAIRPSFAVGPYGRVVCRTAGFGERRCRARNVGHVEGIEGLSEKLRHSEPRELFQLDAEEFLSCLRTARPGAALGPSGMTADH